MSKNVKYSSISENAIRVNTSDMLMHAKALDMIVYDRYIERENRQVTVTLDTVYKYVFVEKLNMYSWITDDYRYTASDLGIDLTDNNRRQWVANSYMFNRLQIDQNIVDWHVFHSRILRYEFNNLHWFLLNANSDAVKQLGTYHRGYMTNVDILKRRYHDDNVSYDIIGYNLIDALRNIDLPYIVDNECWFMNHKFTFTSQNVNGKRFAVVLCNGDGSRGSVKSELIIETEYVALLLFVNFGNLSFTRSSILFDELYFTVDQSFESIIRDVHTGESRFNGILTAQRTYDLIKFIDLYRASLSELLTVNLKSRICAGIEIDQIPPKTVETVLNDISIDPPYQIIM